MQIKNSEGTYGLVAKLFHWLMAASIIGMLFLGLYMTYGSLGEDRGVYYSFHKATGILLLLILVLRLIWRNINIQPNLPDSIPPMQKLLAHFMHINLYIMIFVIPITGRLTSSSAGRDVSFYGLFNMPALSGRNDSIKNIAGGMHQVFAYILVVLLLLHIAAALIHHFLNKDDTLKRML